MPIGTVRKSRRQSCPRLFSYTLFLSYKTFSVPASLSIVAALAGFPAFLTVSKHPFLFICQFQRMIITKTDRQPYVGTMQKVFDIMTLCHMNVHSLPASTLKIYVVWEQNVVCSSSPMHGSPMSSQSPSRFFALKYFA